MDTRVLRKLNELMADYVDRMQAAEQPLMHIETTEMGDGSGRWAVLATFLGQGNHERQIRLTSPAPADAPEWARTEFPDFYFQACPAPVGA